ncbi:actin-bundling T4SS effector WalE1 family protein [Wolbachia endosymbiont (group A) of Rhinocyllus conicus]|uniref:actin-bundling T4SS effector WalE1 family protein n=1 Tax=Wolbachia endosymbiont (group A) of Rhinocyllus conicus TaxID=2954053 RepID=UPI002227368B|nr:hypothetical protein [Wolbachia endosymbiont (group A) of Rhinocyllus conicus]
MLASKQTNSSPVKKNSPFMETVQDKLKDIKNFSNWSAKEQMIAVGAVGVMVGALLPFVAVALPVAATGAIVALTLFFAYKAVEYTFKGLKWSAEKTVDGAKYTAEKVKDASTYAAGKIRDGAVRAKDKIKSSTSHVVHNVSQSLDRLSSQTNYSDAMLNSQLLSGDAKDKIVSIKEQLMGIFNNKEIANKDKLLEKILKDIVLQIESKKDHAQGTDSEKYAPEWDKQINFIKGLNAEKLHDLLTKQSLPKDTYFLSTIFFEHHDEIKRIVKERKTEHKLSNSIENLNKVAGKYGTLRGSIQFGGSNVEKQLHEPFSSDLGVLDKTATVDPAHLRSNSSSRLTPKLTPIASPKVPESPTLEDEWSKFVDQRVKHHALSARTSGGDKEQQEPPTFTPKVPGSPSIDSGMDSGSSTPSEYCTPNASGMSTPSEYCTPNASGVSTPIGNRFSQGVDGEGLKRRLERLKSEPVKQKRDFTSSDFHDSGRGSSGSSTPKSPSPEDLSKARAELKKTGYLGKMVEQPSTQMAVEADVHPQLATIQGATNVKA